MVTKTTTKPKAPAKRTTAAKRSPAKKAATPTKAATAVKSTRTRKAAAAEPTPKVDGRKNRSGNGQTYDKGAHGFVKGTDQAKIADLLIKGGAGRKDIAAKATAVIEPNNRNGKPKPIGTMVANVARKLEANGYEIRETIKAVKPKG